MMPGVLTESRNLAAYFEAVVKSGADPKLTANWIQRISHLAETTANLMQSVDQRYGRLAAEKLSRFIQLVAEGRITAASGRAVLAKMFETGREAEEIVAEEGLTQVSDRTAIEAIARAVVAKSPDNVAKYRSGSEGVFKFFVGQVMKETRGQANPQIVNEILKRVLAES